MADLRSPLFVIILALYLIAGGLYAFLTPAWQAPDEPAHYNYVRHLVSQPGFPKLATNCYNQEYLNQLTSQRFPPDLSINGICYEFHQPPFYYLLGMPVFVLSNGWLQLLRFFSMAVLGSGVVILAFFISHTIFPRKPVIAYGTMAFVAFVPMHLAILSAINNDVLAELILSIILFILVQRLMATPPTPDKPKPYFQNNWLLAVILGLGLGTKTTIYIAIPLIAVTLWWTSKAKTGDRNWRELAQDVAIVFGVAFVIVLPWYIRNAIIYGKFDILGLIRHDEIVTGQLRTADYLAEVGFLTYINNFTTTTWHSFWGQFGWMSVPMDGRTYLLLTLLALISVGGLIGCGWRVYKKNYSLPINQRYALGLMGLTIILMALVYLGYNLAFKQFQGRYLFPALTPIGLFFTLGLHEVFSPRRMWWLVSGLGTATGLIVVNSFINNTFDKWTFLLLGLAFIVTLGRALLAHFQKIQIPATWLMGACYSALIFLALASPFWFIVPYLSP